MVTAKLVEVEYRYELNTKCPRCGKSTDVYIGSKERKFGEIIEVTCRKCGLVFKENVGFDYNLTKEKNK